MPGKKGSKSKTRPTELRGAIDQKEGDIVVVVFDDEQRLDWPRRFVPDDARSGDAVVVRTAPADEARWSGEAQAIGKITLGKQSIQWPGKLEDGPIGLTLTIDAEDTAARKERVRGLVDDIFKKKS